MTTSTYVDLVQTAYRVDLDDEAWVDSLAGQVDSIFGQSATAAYIVRPGGLRAGPPGGQAIRGSMGGMFESCIAKTAEFPEEMFQFAFQGGPFAELLSHRLKRFSDPQMPSDLARAFAESAGGMTNDASDVLGIYGGTKSGGCMLTVFGAKKRLAPRTRWALKHVAVHIAAAYRLRADGMRDPDALLDEQGRVLEAAAGFDEAPETLSSAARDVRTAESLAARAPESAVAVWRGLVEGRWSLVRATDDRGRRRMLLRRNEIEEARGDDARARRMSSVMALAARGHANKLIAYELGLTPSTVAGDLKEGLARLGLKTRSELVKLGSFGGA